MKYLPIIILHGWGCNAATWDKPKELLEKAGFTVFVPDLPGFGKEPPPKTAYSVSDYVNWVLRFAELEKLDKFVLIGHSFGGRISIKLAAEYPQKVDKLILTGAAGIRFVSFFEKIRVEAYQFICVLGELPFRVYALTNLKPLVRKILYWLAGTKDYYNATNPVMKETFKKVINEELINLLENIKAPTLLLWGEDDLMVPIKHAQIMYEKIPGAKLEIIKNAGHRMPYGQPEVFVERVTKFRK